MLDREGVSLDTFCADVDDTCFHSSIASSARLVVLAYFRLLEQINSPPVPLLRLALRRFAQDEARVE